MEGWIYIGLERDIVVEGHNGVKLLGVDGEGGGRPDTSLPNFFPPPPNENSFASGGCGTSPITALVQHL
jgi:hypothetical protein